MKKIILPLAIPFFLIASTNAQTRKALFVIIDGVAADVIEKLDLLNIKRISRDGAYTRAYLGGQRANYSQTPTISAVGYNSLLTGTWANKHNVWDNNITDPNYHYPTIFKLLKETYPQKETAIFSTWKDNRTLLLGDGLAATGFKVDYSFDGLEHDTLRFPHDKHSDYIRAIDDEVAQEAASYIKKNAPDLSWVYLQYTDDMGHAHGDSDPYYSAVKIADRQIGQIYDAVKYREQKWNEEWLVFITTDHGREAATGKGHGGQSDRERGIWIATNARQLNHYFKATTPAVTDILPSIADFLNIQIAENRAAELDGVSLISPISIANPKAAAKIGNKLIVEWDAYEPKGKVQVFISSTNLYKNGGVDTYEKLGEADLMNQKYTVPYPFSSGTTYKVLLKGPRNVVNTWIVIP